jgi:hypothetical protein
MRGKGTNPGLQLPPYTKEDRTEKYKKASAVLSILKEWAIFDMKL